MNAHSMRCEPFVRAHHLQTCPVPERLCGIQTMPLSVFPRLRGAFYVLDLKCFAQVALSVQPCFAR